MDDKAIIDKTDHRHAMPQRDSPEPNWNLVVPNISTQGSKHNSYLSFPGAQNDFGILPLAGRE
jgi:hypothetical protein